MYAIIFSNNVRTRTYTHDAQQVAKELCDQYNAYHGMSVTVQRIENELLVKRQLRKAQLVRKGIVPEFEHDFEVTERGRQRFLLRLEVMATDYATAGGLFE